MEELDADNVAEEAPPAMSEQPVLDPTCAHLQRITNNVTLEIPDNIALRKDVITIGRNHDCVDVYDIFLQ